MEMFFDEEVPTEDMIDHMEERLEMVTSQQKNLFLIIFQVGFRLQVNVVCVYYSMLHSLIMLQSQYN